MENSEAQMGSQAMGNGNGALEQQSIRGESQRPTLRQGLQLLLLALCLGFAGKAAAEPWLSTRYAQNCAGCHAPGRKNVAAIDRRCTLSCQGCHVNPNGGGLRSTYGKWNEERWLRSFRADVLRDAASTAPVTKQWYSRSDKADINAAEAKEAKDVAGKGKNIASDDKNAKFKARKHGPGAKGFPLVESDDTEMDEKLFTRGDGLEKIISKNREEFMYQVPQDDPLRIMDETKTSAGADVRWEADSWSTTGTNGQMKRWDSFLMSADFGVEWRPIYHNVHFVYEARIQGNPPSPGSNPDYEQTLGTGRTHSLYMMVDDLPYNVFVMGGYYRPLFGNFVPDHYTLAQEMTSYGMTGNPKNYNIMFNAFSIGTAPNVPYLNVHLIQDEIQAGLVGDKTHGYAANAGMRFVTLGASINYSYWRTKNKLVGQTTGVEMHSIGAAARYWRTVASIEGVSVARDTDTSDYRQGGVWTLDTSTQLWRENYLTLLYAQSNALSSSIKPGKNTQVKAGIRSFVVQGVDVWLTAENREDDDSLQKTQTKLTSYAGQLHLYF